MENSERELIEMEIFRDYYGLSLMLIILSGIGIYKSFTSMMAVIVEMDTNLNYTFEMNGKQTFKISGKSKTMFDDIVKNRMEGVS